MTVPKSLRLPATLVAALCLSAVSAGPALATSGPTITDPADPGYVNNYSPAVSFTGATANTTVTLYVDGATPDGTGTSDSNGNGTITPTSPIASTPGEHHSLAVTDTDASGLGQANEVYFNEVPALSGPTDGSTVNAQDVSFVATQAIPSENVELFMDGNQVATETADGTGTASNMAPSGPLSPGQHTFTAKAVDNHGQLSDASATTTLTVRPASPSFTSPTDGAQLNQGQPTISVTADPTATATAVKLYDIDGQGNPVEIASTNSVGQNGAASLSPSTPLADGQHSLSVTQTVNGVESDPTAPGIAVTVQTTAPSLDNSLNGTTSNHNRPWLYGSGGLPNNGNDTNNKLAFYIDGVQAGEESTDGGGMTAFQPATPLTDGQHTAYVVTVDDQGHESTVHSNTVTFTVDATAPAAPVITAPSSGATLTTNKPTVTLTAEPNSTASVYLDGNWVADTQVDGQGKASYTFASPISDGQHTVTATATDTAGNTSGSAQGVSFRVSTQPAPQPTPQPQPQPTPTPQPTQPNPQPKPAPTPQQPQRVTLSSHTLTSSQPVKLGFSVSRPSTLQVKLVRLVHHHWLTVATVSVQVKAGHGSYVLHQRFGGHTLAPGSYQVSLQAKSGHAASRAVHEQLAVR